MSRNRIIIELEAERDDCDPHDLAGLLKRALRLHGWRCVSIRQADAETDQPKGRPDRDLDRLAAVWPTLGPHVQRAILAIATADAGDAAEVVDAMRANQQRIDAEALARLGPRD